MCSSEFEAGETSSKISFELWEELLKSFSAFKSSVKAIGVRPLTGLPESFSSLKELYHKYVKAGDVVHFVY